MSTNTLYPQHRPASHRHAWRWGRGVVATILVAALQLSCADDFIGGFSAEGTTTGDTECIRFGITTVEQIDLIYDMARTRGADDRSNSAFVRANTPQAFPFEGDAYGLQAHTMPLPFVEIHPRTASARAAASAAALPCDESQGTDPAASSPAPASSPAASSPAAAVAGVACPAAPQQGATRAPLSEIASTESFHDSLTIWGFISTTTAAHSSATLFSKVNLKKIRNWRSSVHWPYDGDAGGNRTMRFYAISPSIDELEFSPQNTPNFNTAPEFSYHVVADVAEHRDLLYGVSTNGGRSGAVVTTESSEIEIANGPIHEGNYFDANWTEDKHLGEDNKSVDLKFQHILTAVRFAQGKIPTSVRISKITLQGINDRGTFTGSTAGGGAWSGLSGSQNYSIDVAWQPKEWNEASYTSTKEDKTTIADTYKDDPTVSPYIDGENVYIDRNQVMFLLPQTLSDAQLSIELDELDASGNTTRRHTVHASISGTWAMGHTVTYKITIGELRGDYQLIVTPPAIFEHSLDEQTGTFTAHSYRAFTDFSTDNAGVAQKYHAIGWRVTGLYQDINCSVDKAIDFSSSFVKTIDGNGTTVPGVADTDGDDNGKLDDKRTVSVTILGQESSTSGNHETLLSENATSVSADHWDLSRMKVITADGGNLNYGHDKSCDRITANSYIINRHGSYRFPLIYGNASEYSSSDLESNETFVDHEGSYIKKAWITDQLNSNINTSKRRVEGDAVIDQRYEYINLSAKLIWQDRESLINNDLTISEPEAGKYFLDFSISQNNLKPGNAVIALMGKKTTTTVTTTTTSSTSTLKGETAGTTYTPDEASFNNGNGTKTVITIDGEIVTTETTTKEKTETTEETPQVLWSWHIWVTDEVYPNHDERRSRLIELEKVGQKTMAVNLGWVADNPAWVHYAYRELYAKIEQVGTDGQSLANNGGQTAKIKIAQKAKQPLITGTATFYQWGRFNALPGVSKAQEGKGINDNEERKIYDISNNVVTLGTKDTKNYLPDALKLAILNPLSMLRNSDSNPNSRDWFDPNNLKDFWGNNGAKSLYDPCPPGFRLPNINVFAPEYVDNYPHDYKEHYGMYFYPTVYNNSVNTNDNDPATWNVPYFYLPATGNWSANTSGDNIWEQLDDKKDGYLWTSSYKDKTTTDYGPGYIKVYMTDSNDKNALIYDYNTVTTVGSETKYGDGHFSRGMQIRPVGNGRY